MAKFLLPTIPLATFGLGVWQVQRWKWKLNLIDEMEKKVGAEPVQFPSHDLDQLRDLEYQKVRLRGHFDSSKELIMGPRSLLSSEKEAESRGLSSNAKPGYHVVTPFKVANQDLTVLVNRGWIPSKQYKNFKADDAEDVEIIGVVRKEEKRAPFMAKNIPGSLWFSRDVPAMAEHLGTAPAFLDLASVVGQNLKSNPLSPVPGQTRVTMKNDHVSYFLTWFSLSGITGYMCYRIFILKKPLR